MTLQRITMELAGAEDLVQVASSICVLSHELYEIFSTIVLIHDSDGRPLHAVDNAPDVTDEHRRSYFDRLWQEAPLRMYLRTVGNRAAEAPGWLELERGAGYNDHVVHTRIAPLLCPVGLLGAIKFRHDARISDALWSDLSTLAAAASVRFTALNVGAWPDPTTALLTRRQLDVARCAADGMRNGEIAKSLGLTENTVKKHVKDALERLGVASRTELAGVIRRAGPIHGHPVGITHRGTLSITRAG